MKTRIFYLQLVCISIFVLTISCSTPGSLKTNLSEFHQLDSLINTWKIDNAPGGVIGVMKNGKEQYLGTYGLSSMEYKIPVTDTTLFNIASVSKEFTAYAMLLLQQQGKLKITDEIHTYLPELPDFGYPIRINHLIHHTSGLRSLHAMLQMAGWKKDDRRDNGDLLRFMKRQKELNFKPGDEYLYCNTGYILMAEIAQRVTGESFISWLSSHVFKPLSMDHTYLEANFDSIAVNNATSYNWIPEKKRYEQATPYWGYIGSGNIHTNVHDLLKWLDFLNHPDPEHADLVTNMFERGILNNGDTLDYAFGLTVKTYKGDKIIGHGGSIGGFRASIGTLPDEDLSVVVLTNYSNANAGRKRNAIIDILRGHKSEEIQNKQQPTRKKQAIKPVTEQINGQYYSPELMTTYTLRSLGDSVEVFHPRLGKAYMSMTHQDTLMATHPYPFRQAVIIYETDDHSIAGLRVSNGRVRNMWFEKQN